MNPSSSQLPGSAPAALRARAVEAGEKIERVRGLIAARSLDGVLLTTQPNVSWILAGVDHLVVRSHDRGFAWVLITPEEAFVLGLNNEEALLRHELAVEEIGFNLLSVDWANSTLDDAAMSIRPAERLATDAYGPGVTMAEEIQRLRLVLTGGERQRIRELGSDTCDAVEEALIEIEPGEFRSLQERALGSRIVAGLERHGILATGLMIGGAERRRRFRHPTVTAAPLGDDVLVVAVGMRGGLHVALSRTAAAGPVGEDTRERHRVAATVEAEMIAATRPGAPWADALEAGLRAYAAAGYGPDWHDHTQGGPIGYGPREFIAYPRDSRLTVPEPAVQANQAYAWNPTLAGAKSEDTFLVKADGFEPISNSDRWPLLTVESSAGPIDRPEILEL